MKKVTTSQFRTQKGKQFKPPFIKKYMVKKKLQWHDALQVDAADALAIAICHSCHQRTRIATELTR